METSSDNQLNNLRKLYTIPEARSVLGGISHSLIYTLIKDGRLTIVKIGRRSFISSLELMRFLKDVGAV